MTGYTVKEINDLLESIRASYDGIHDAMATPWPGLSQKMRLEWVGEDEYQNEEALSDAMIKLHTDCIEAIKLVIKNITNLGETWRSFQAQNTIEGAKSVDVANIASIDEVTVTPKDLELYQAGERLDASVQLGLRNGASSATAVETAIDEYAKSVKDKVTGLYNNLDASKAFLDQQESLNVTNYLHKVGESIASLTTCIKSIKLAIAAAAKQYQKQAESNAGEVASSDTDILGGNAGESL